MSRQCLAAMRFTTLFLCVMCLLPLFAPNSMAHAFQKDDECRVILCGPSGMFTRDVIPTSARLDFKAFPKNPSRPYPVKGRTWIVSPAGNDQADGSAEKPLATIPRAAELAQSGDAIQVADGTYRVALEGGSGIVLDKPGVTLFAENIGGVTLESGSDAWTAIEVSADDLIVDGFIIKVSPRGYGVYFGSLKRPQRNLVLKNLLIDGGESGISSVITPDGQANPQPVINGLLVNHVFIRHASLIGFNCGQGPCDGMRLENIVVQMNYDPTIENSGADAMAVENGDNILVFNVELTGASADGLDTKATHVAAINVAVHDVARNGIKLWHDGDVVNALVYNTGADAAVVFDAGGAYRVLHTIVARHEYKNPGSAYAMTVAGDNRTDPGTLTIANSIFYQNSAAIWVSGAFKLDARNNIFFGSGNGQELVWQLDPEITIGEEAGPVQDLEKAGGGSGNIGFVDPKFVKPDAGNFTLAPGSPARDSGAAGQPDSPDFDMLGNPRVSGKGPDLGPVEAK